MNTKVASELVKIAKKIAGGESKGTYLIYRNVVELRKAWGDGSEFESFLRVLKDAIKDIYNEDVRFSGIKGNVFMNRQMKIFESTAKVEFAGDTDLLPRFRDDKDGWEKFHKLNTVLRRAGYKESKR